MNRTVSRLRATTALAVAALAVNPARAIAQGTLGYERTTFLHGIGSSDAIWKARYSELYSLTTPQYLSGTFALGGVAYPNLNAGAFTAPDGRTAGLRFDGQVNNLVQMIGANGGRHVLVAHSLGSLIARGAQSHNPGQVAGIVAIAAPHQGANIANPGVADNALAYVQEIDNALQEVTVSRIATGLFVWMIPFMQYFALKIFFGNTPDFPTGGVQDLGRLEALKDLEYSSGAVVALNYYRGDAGIPRANVVGRIPMEHAILRLAAGREGAPNFNELKKMKDEGLRSLGNCRNLGNWTFNLTDPGNRCERAYRLLAYLDPVWQGTINGTEYGVVREAYWSMGRYRPALYGQVPRKVPFDGVVPNERSNYPGLYDISYQFLADGTNHLDIYRNPLGVNKIAVAMGKIGMQDPLTGPATIFPALALTAGINGPAEVSAGEIGSWYASVSGGAPPYTYQWSGIASGTGPSVDATVDGAATLFLTVRDAVGVYVSTQLNVSLPSGGGGAGCEDSSQILCDRNGNMYSRTPSSGGNFAAAPGVSAASKRQPAQPGSPSTRARAASRRPAAAPPRP